MAQIRGAIAVKPGTPEAISGANIDEGSTQNDDFDLRSAISRALSSTYIGYDRMEILGRITTPASARPSSRQPTEGQHKILQRRDAQDKLLFNQLKLGIIPENLFKRSASSSHLQTLDLSYFGLGDEMGLCLGLR
jgi:hypothetical protein